MEPSLPLQPTDQDRIALLIPVLAGGGAERVMVNLAQALVSEGVSVDMVVLRAEGDYLEEVRGMSGVRLVVLGCAKSTTSALAIARYLKRERPFAVISALYTLTLSCIVAARTSGYRGTVIATVHNTLSTDIATGARLLDRLWLNAIRLVMPRADAIVAVSSGAADDLARTAGIPRERVEVIFNPVVSPRMYLRSLEAPTHRWLAQAGDLPVIVGVGRLTPQKDFATLMRAFHLVRQQRPARLLILGEGPERPALERLALELGIADHVELPGFEANPYAALANSAVFVLSSRWEGLPTVLIEALALGVPVVATDCASGPREILDGGRIGPLAPVGDEEALSGAILSQLQRERDPAAGLALAEPYTFHAASAAYLSLARGGR